MAKFETKLKKVYFSAFQNHLTLIVIPQKTKMSTKFARKTIRLQIAFPVTQNTKVIQIHQLVRRLTLKPKEILKVQKRNKDLMSLKG